MIARIPAIKSPYAAGTDHDFGSAPDTTPGARKLIPIKRKNRCGAANQISACSLLLTRTQGHTKSTATIAELRRLVRILSPKCGAAVHRPAPGFDIAGSRPCALSSAILERSVCRRASKAASGVTSVSIRGQTGRLVIRSSNSSADSAATMSTSATAPLTGPPASIFPSAWRFAKVERWKDKLLNEAIPSSGRIGRAELLSRDCARCSTAPSFAELYRTVRSTNSSPSDYRDHLHVVNDGHKSLEKVLKRSLGRVTPSRGLAVFTVRNGMWRL
jgi:hypothetical protein